MVIVECMAIAKVKEGLMELIELSKLMELGKLIEFSELDNDKMEALYG